MITSTNKEAYPNTLIVILGHDEGRSSFEEKEDVTRVTNDEGKTIGYNFFNVDEVGFTDKLAYGKPTLVYGYVKTCEPHPDSDHLHVTTVEVADGEEHQIVCGAPNIAQGQKVVVALPGTLMPNGAQIWPGELRGVDSYGMICSARELGLPHAPQKRGIMVVADSFEVGAEFEPTKCDELIASGEITL